MNTRAASRSWRKAPSFIRGNRESQPSCATGVRSGFGALTASVGCSDHNFALVGREMLPARATTAVQSEIVGTVERLGKTLLQLARTLGKKDPRSIRIEQKITHEESSEVVRRTLHRMDSLFCQVGFLNADDLWKRSRDDKSHTYGNRSTTAGPRTRSGNGATQSDTPVSV